MQDKYNPLHVASHVWGKFFTLSGHQNSSVEDYSVCIEIKGSENECYLINPTATGYLWKGTCSRDIWRVVEDTEELYKKRDLLGAVHIRFRDEPIKIEDKVLEPFPNYALFWDYLTR